MAGTLIAGDVECILVIPCYNEAKRLPSDSFQEFLSRPSNIGFLFVNDGSTDDTIAVIEALHEQFPDRVDTLSLARNSGKAEAVRSGMQQAIQMRGVKYVGFWDADLATPLEEGPRLLAQLIEKPGVEIVLGSRVRLLGRSIHRSPMRHYSGRIFATLASRSLSIPVYDTQCGAKIFRVTPVLSEILAKPFHSRWTFDVEMLARYLNLDPAGIDHAASNIYEEPLRRWEDARGSKLKLRDAFLALIDLLVIRRTYFTKRSR